MPFLLYQCDQMGFLSLLWVIAGVTPAEICPCPLCCLWDWQHQGFCFRCCYPVAGLGFTSELCGLKQFPERRLPQRAGSKMSVWKVQGPFRRLHQGAEKPIVAIATHAPCLTYLQSQHLPAQKGISFILCSQVSAQYSLCYPSF